MQGPQGVRAAKKVTFRRDDGSSTSERDMLSLPSRPQSNQNSSANQLKPRKKISARPAMQANFSGARKQDAAFIASHQTVVNFPSARPSKQARQTKRPASIDLNLPFGTAVVDWASSSRRRIDQTIDENDVEDPNAYLKENRLKETQDGSLELSGRGKKKFKPMAGRMTTSRPSRAKEVVHADWKRLPQADRRGSRRGYLPGDDLTATDPSDGVRAAAGRPNAQVRDVEMQPVQTNLGDDSDDDMYTHDESEIESPEPQRIPRDAIRAARKQEKRPVQVSRKSGAKKGSAVPVVSSNEEEEDEDEDEAMSVASSPHSSSSEHSSESSPEPSSSESDDEILEIVRPRAPPRDRISGLYPHQIRAVLEAHEQLPASFIKTMLALGDVMARLQNTKSLPFLPRNMRKILKLICLKEGIPTSYPPDLAVPRVIVVYEGELWGSVQTDALKFLQCPFCSIYRYFGTREMMARHLYISHKEIPSSWSSSIGKDGVEEWTLTLSLPNILADEQGQHALSTPSRNQRLLPPSLQHSAIRPNQSAVIPRSTAQLIKREPSPDYSPPNGTPFSLSSGDTPDRSVSTTSQVPIHKRSPSPTDGSRDRSILSYVAPKLKPDEEPDWVPSHEKYDPDIHPKPPPKSRPYGPAQRRPYCRKAASGELQVGLEYSTRIGGEKLYDILAELPMDEFGVLEWQITDAEEECFECDDISDETKVLKALWIRWVFHVQNRFHFSIKPYDGLKKFIEKYWEIIHRAAGWEALRDFLAVKVYLRYIDLDETRKLLKAYEKKTGMDYWLGECEANYSEVDLR